MSSIYKTEQGEQAIRERYLRFLNRWPVANQQLRVPTRQGGPRGDGLFCRICVRVVSTACFFLDGARVAVRCRGLTTIAGATAGHTLL